MKGYGILRFFNPTITKQSLSDKDRSQLDMRVAETEKRTGAQIVLSVIERCDDYPELPWKAFALGASIAGLLFLVVDMFRPAWISGTTVFFAVVVILAAGAVGALLCIFVPCFARFFLDEGRSEVEVRQYAESLFLSRELFTTQERTGILLLVGLFERQVVLLPDTGLADRLNQTVLQEIIDQITNILTSGRIPDALEEGLRGLDKILSDTKPIKHKENELPDKIIEEEGS